MGIKQKVKGMLGEISDRYYLMRARSVEIKKYRDSHRKKIMEQRPLSDQEKAKIDAFYLKNYGKKFCMCGISIILLLRETLMWNIFRNCCLSRNLKDT